MKLREGEAFSGNECRSEILGLREIEALTPRSSMCGVRRCGVGGIYGVGRICGWLFGNIDLKKNAGWGTRPTKDHGRKDIVLYVNSAFGVAYYVRCGSGRAGGMFAEDFDGVFDIGIVEEDVEVFEAVALGELVGDEGEGKILGICGRGGPFTGL
jgi:hypothetical protein